MHYFCLHGRRARREATLKSSCCAQKQNGGLVPPLGDSPHDEAAAGVLAVLRPERAPLARTAPHSSRGSLLNAADILPLELSTTTNWQHSKKTCGDRSRMRMRILFPEKEACPRKILRGNSCSLGSGRRSGRSFYDRGRRPSAARGSLSCASTKLTGVQHRTR